MSQVIACPHCSARLKALAEQLIGRTVRCPKCSGEFGVAAPVEWTGEAVAPAPSPQPEPPASSVAPEPPSPTTPRKKKKKKKKRSGGGVPAWVWWWGTLTTAVVLTVVGLVSMAMSGYRLTALYCAFGLLVSL